MVTRSAGLLLYRPAGSGLEVLIVHMGGPFWSGKDERAWSIPKGEYGDGEDPYAVAYREFSEELGTSPPPGEAVDLGELRQPSGKRIRVWALRGDFDATAAVSNTFSLEWPKGSGRMQEFPEVDRAEWYAVDAARTKLVRGQVGFLDRLLATAEEATPSG